MAALLFLPLSKEQKGYVQEQGEMCELGLFGGMCVVHVARMWACWRGGGTHDRRLGFVLKAAENTEECEVNDDMVENSVEQDVCLQAQIMKPFLCLELELNACFRALSEFGSSRSVHPQGKGLTTDDLLADPVFRQC